MDRGPLKPNVLPADAGELEPTIELPAPEAPGPRLGPPLVLVTLFWAIYASWRWTELGFAFGFKGFLAVASGGIIVALLVAVWWLIARGLQPSVRYGVFSVALAGGISAAALADRSIGAFLVLPGLPLVVSAWLAALVVARRWAPRRRFAVVAGALCAAWSAFLLLRADGMGGDGQLVLRWRWTPVAEAVYLAERELAAAPRSAHKQRLTVEPGDWPGFRGPRRDASVIGVRIATDWDHSPPQLLWKRRIGPGWSSMAVVGQRLFTQEQVGPQEAVIAIDTSSGRTLWSHVDSARHEDPRSGAGPRATPTIADGRVFALGASGILNCLDAETGERQWFRDVAADAGPEQPMYGFASSPLVIDGLVYVFAAESPQKSVLAYCVDSGEPVWSAAAGKASYSSPHVAAILGKMQLLLASDQGLVALDPASGARLWQQPAAPEHPGVVQPHQAGDDAVIFDSGDSGTILVKVSSTADAWTAAEAWASKQLKPSFNDFVVHEGAIYGFDGRVFTCLDLETGKRRWKEGRYGSGQVLLLPDQPLLVVVSDDGEVVLVAADPAEHRELGRFRAIEGKTWNHPAITHGRLYVRNAEEMACYALRLEGQ